jgi:hypothetical protein
MPTSFIIDLLLSYYSLCQFPWILEIYATKSCMHDSEELGFACSPLRTLGICSQRKSVVVAVSDANWVSPLVIVLFRVLLTISSIDSGRFLLLIER